MPRRPLPRTAHQAVIYKGYIYVFGGEFTSLNQVGLITKTSWQLLSGPGAPCCLHSSEGGSPTLSRLRLFLISPAPPRPQPSPLLPAPFLVPCRLQEKFRHYGDLWRLSLVDWRWEQLPGKGGPSPRSGHRMAVYKSTIVLFGGFFDNGKETKWVRVAGRGEGGSGGA